MNLSVEYLYIYGCIFIFYNIIVAYLLYYIWRLKKYYKSSIVQNMYHPSQPRSAHNQHINIPICKDVKIDKSSTNDCSNVKTLHENIQREDDAISLEINNAINEKREAETKSDESNHDTTPKLIRKPKLPHGITHRFSNVIEQLKMKTGKVNFTKSSKEEEHKYILDNSITFLQQENYNIEMELFDRNEKSAVINNRKEDEVINMDITNGRVVKVETVNTANNPHEIKTEEISYDCKNKLGQAILLPNVLEELKVKTLEKNPSTLDANSENLNNDFVTSIQESVNENKRLSVSSKKSFSQDLDNLDNIEAKNNESHDDTENMNINNLQNIESDSLENLEETKIKEKISDVVSSLDTVISVEPVYDRLSQSRRKFIFEGDSQYLTFQSSNSPRNKESYVNAKMCGSNDL